MLGPPGFKLLSTVIRKSVVKGMQGNFLLFVKCTTTFEPPINKSIEHTEEGFCTGNETLREQLAQPKLPSHQVRFGKERPSSQLLQWSASSVKGWD